MREITIFSGSAHCALAEEVCRERDVFILQPLVPPVQEHLMELLLMLDAARDASARRTTAVIPYYAYARSDKKDAPRISIAGRLVADLLTAAGASRVLTMTLHTPQVHGFFRVPVDHLNALNLFAAYFQARDLAHTVVVSPDLGNAKSASHLARLLNLPVAAGSKRRIDDEHVVIDRIVGDVTGKNVILLDDEIANGGTVIEMLRLLGEHRVGRIAVACTHGLFTGSAVARLSAQQDVDEVVTTNTVPLARTKIEALPTLRVLSVAPLLAAAIKRIHDGESISSLFDG
jgi:ribose-phosphate pyrophosphokinase